MKSSRTGDGSTTALVSDSQQERVDVRRWWRRLKDEPLGEVANRVQLPQALHDVSVMALAHMARRLDSKGTPARIKDRIALALGPKVFIHAHAGVAPPADQTASDLLRAYEQSPPHKLDS